MSVKLISSATLSGRLTQAGDGGPLRIDLAEQISRTIVDGQGANRARAVYIDEFTIPASGAIEVNLLAGMTDRLGNTLSVSGIKELWVRADDDNAHDIIVHGGANAFLGPFSAETVTVAVPAKGDHRQRNYDATGWPVNASRGRIRLANGGSVSSVIGRIMLVLAAMAVVPIPLPSDFLSRWTPNFNLLRTEAGGIACDLDYTALKPAIAKSYYVKSTGSDVAAGTSGAPLLSLSTALGKSDVDEVVIDCSAGDYIMRNSRGWNNVQPARDVSVRVIGPGRAISVQSATVSAPTWVNTAGAVYKTTITAANSSSVIDLANKQADGFYQRLAPVASTAAVAATPGSYFHDGTDLHVQAYDSRNLVGDLLMAPCTQSNNMRVPSANRTLHVDGMDFVGGVPLMYTATATFDPLVVAVNCTFQGSHSSNANAVNILGPGRFYFYRCGAGRAHRDAFNYHGNGFGDPKYFENECYTDESGYVGTSDNATTSHENAIGIRINGRYRHALNRTIADIDNTISYIGGCYIGQARTVGVANECLAQQGANKTYIELCEFEAGPNPQLVLTSTATLSYRNMAAPVRAGTGEDTGTMLQWAA